MPPQESALGADPGAPFTAARALGLGLSCWAARLPTLLAVAGIVLLLNGPSQFLQGFAVSTAESVSARVAARGDRAPEPEEAIEDLQALGPACGGLCGSLLVGVFLSAPVMAGATVVGARAVRGNGRVTDAFAAFRRGRYLPTLSVTAITILVGGGAAVLVAAVQAVAVAGAASRVVSSIAGPGTVLSIAVVLGAVTLWLSARLWFALTRAADPDRPAVGGMSAVGRSWHWTEGGAQWGVLGLMLLLAAATVALLLPSAWIGAADADAVGGSLATPGPWRPAASSLAATAGVALSATLWMAVLGAAYELLAARHEPAGGAGVGAEGMD